MATGVKTYQVDIATNPSTIIVTAEPIADNVPETLPVANILSVTPVYFDFGPPSVPVTAAISSYGAGPSEITFPGVYTPDINAGDLLVVTGSTATQVSTAVTAYTTTPDSISFAGVYTDYITVGMLFTITGSTNNDGVYTAVSVSDNGIDTTVVVAELINPAIVDGNVAFTPIDNDGTFTVVSVSDNGIDTTVVVTETINPGVTGGDVEFTPQSGNVENNNTGDEFRATYPYQRMTRLIIELHDDKKLDLELQSITNQPTWSLGTKAALKTAALAINALL